MYCWNICFEIELHFGIKPNNSQNKMKFILIATLIAIGFCKPTIEEIKSFEQFKVSIHVQFIFLI